MSRTDPHTAHQVGQPVPTHIVFKVTVDFKTKTLAVIQEVTFDKEGEVTFDSMGQISLIVSHGDHNVGYDQGDYDSIRGTPITFEVPAELKMRLVYTVGPEAKGVQWLSDVQTGGNGPLLYTQFESICARSVFIVPDSPAIRFTYKMTIDYMGEMEGLASATRQSNYWHRAGQTQSTWDMEVAVPAYLIALNVGAFEMCLLGDNCAVYVLPDCVRQAELALARTPEVVASYAKLFGNYRWGKYDTVVLPALGYPFGAMEHPCLTSMNAALITDPDEALRVTIHEMGHSWFGNLITNATWGDFWLNEGVTTFAEWLVTRNVLGLEAMQLRIAQSIEELRQLIDQLIQDGKPGLTQLKTDLSGQDPEDAFNRVPYFKGALFLWAVMDVIGEGEMVKFLRSYIDKFASQSITTEEFLAFMSEQLGPDVFASVDVDMWVYQPGMPKSLPYFHSEIVTEVVGFASAGKQPDQDTRERWGNQQWYLYFSTLSDTAPACVLSQLDHKYGFSTSPVCMLQFEFLCAVLRRVDLTEKYLSAIRSFLLSYGRTVYVKPLYRALCDQGYREQALGIYVEAKPGYHPIAADQVAKLLGLV